MTTHINMPAKPLDNRFAEQIITATNVAEFTNLEIQGVREHDAGTLSAFCEVDNEDPEFFSVYARLGRGGCNCVSDHDTYGMALAYAEKLAQTYNWEIYDLTDKHHLDTVITA